MSYFDNYFISKLKQLADDIGSHSLGVCSAPLKVKSHFPWAKSVISASLPFTHLLNKNKYLPSKFISLSALDNDYHIVLKNKLNSIAEYIHSNYNPKIEILVDTSLFSEHMIALLSKTGWLGKNNNIFTDKFGSFVALGEIITDIEYTKINTEKKKLCGNCRKCIDSCPTGALSESGEFDSSKCLSYITQSSGFINPIYLPLLGTRIFGCNTCQNICPHNIKIYGEVEPNSISQNDIQWLLKLLNADNTYFKEHIKNKAYGWIGRNKLRRNAAIVAGNIKKDIFSESLCKMLNEPHPVIRVTAAWALDQIDSPSAKLFLESTFKSEVSEDVKQYMSNLYDKYTCK